MYRRVSHPYSVSNGCSFFCSSSDLREQRGDRLEASPRLKRVKKKETKKDSKKILIVKLAELLNKAVMWNSTPKTLVPYLAITKTRVKINSHTAKSSVFFLYLALHHLAYTVHHQFRFTVWAISLVIENFAYNVCHQFRQVLYLYCMPSVLMYDLQCWFTLWAISQASSSMLLTMYAISLGSCLTLWSIY